MRCYLLKETDMAWQPIKNPSRAMQHVGFGDGNHPRQPHALFRMIDPAGVDRVVVLDVADFRYAQVNIIGRLSC